MARFVYIIVRDVAKKRAWCDSLTKPGESDTSVFIVEEKTPMDQVVQEIVDRSAPDGMKILRICAHGLPGLVKLGRDCLFDITVPKFKKLNGRFVARGRIELHCCQAGKQRATIIPGSAGWLTKLATHAGVPVMAAEEIQQADVNWEWEGPVYTFAPLGGGYQPDPPEYERMTREDRYG